MDVKEATLIKHYYEKLNKLSFDEKDIYALLILLRSHSQPNSPVYEFANFVAHRERDRGHIYNYLLSMKAFFNRIGITLGDEFEIRPVFTVKEIHDSFNSVFAGLGLPPIADEASGGIVLCIISLLQGVKISDRANQEIGELLFAFDNRDIHLFGKFSVNDFAPYTYLQAPMLTIENRFVQTNITKTSTPGIVEIVNNNGALQIIVWGGSPPTTA